MDDTDQFLAELRRKASRMAYVRSRCVVLGGILRKARAGILEPDWRDRLPQNPLIGDRGDPVGVLLARELTELPVQPWEPYAAHGDWREALDAWYSDTLAVETEYEADRFAPYPRPPESPPLPPIPELPPPPPENASPFEKACAAAAAATLAQVARNIAHAPPDPLTQYAAGQAQQRALDEQERRSQQRKRDGHGASYRAALAAGGDDCDWFGWYQQRIAQWDTESDWPEELSPDMVLDYTTTFFTNRRVYKKPSAALPVDGFKQYLEQLPEYWRRTSSADQK